MNIRFSPFGRPVTTSFAISASLTLKSSNTPTTASYAEYALLPIGPQGRAGQEVDGIIKIKPTPTPTPTPTATPTPTPTGIAPEYWWRADSGLSTSGWTAYAGPANFTFYNVSSADSTDGAYFNGTNSYGTTGLLLNDINAKHILIRADSVDGSAGRTILGSTNSFEPQWYYSTDPGAWRIANYAGDTYWDVLNLPVGNQLTWTDFANYSTVCLTLDNNASCTTYAINDGTFNNNFRFPGNSFDGMYLGVHGTNPVIHFGQFYVKEIAIFTTSYTYNEIKTFRDQMLSRWP